MTVDFDGQTVSVSSAPTASGHVATKGYVDNAVGAAGDATLTMQNTINSRVDNAYSACAFWEAGDNVDMNHNANSCSNSSCPTGWSKVGCMGTSSVGGDFASNFSWYSAGSSSSLAYTKILCCLGR